MKTKRSSIATIAGIGALSFALFSDKWNDGNIYLQGTVVSECDTKGYFADLCEKPFPFNRVEGYYLGIQSEESTYTAIISQFNSANARTNNSIIELSSRIEVGKEVEFLHSYPYNSLMMRRFDSDMLGILYVDEIIPLE